MKNHATLKLVRFGGLSVSKKHGLSCSSVAKGLSHKFINTPNYQLQIGLSKFTKVHKEEIANTSDEERSTATDNNTNVILRTTKRRDKDTEIEFSSSRCPRYWKRSRRSMDSRRQVILRQNRSCWCCDFQNERPDKGDFQLPLDILFMQSVLLVASWHNDGWVMVFHWYTLRCC